jgi:hypothetical protein
MGDSAFDRLPAVAVTGRQPATLAYRLPIVHARLKPIGVHHMPYLVLVVTPAGRGGHGCSRRVS